MGLTNFLNYEFKNDELLIEALTHSSYKNDVGLSDIIDNQKLEFIGDSVLDLIASSFLFSHQEFSKSEGEMTVERSILVKESSLVEYANIISLDKYLILSEAGRNSGIHKLDSSLADAFEALVGAIFLDSDFNTVNRVILDKFKNNFIAKLDKGDSNYKGILNELVNKINGMTISYELLSAEGPDHEKLFKSRVLLNDTEIGKGEGSSILASEQSAADVAIRYIKENFDV